MRSIKKYLAKIFISLSILSICYSQTIPFDSDRWDIDAVESKLEKYLGQNSLFLKGGIAYVKDSEFLNGIIEFDIAFSQERGFMGVVWRLQDLSNYEEFYLRPHQSGNPDANQYTPVFNGLSAWQLYHGEGYGAPVKYVSNEWMHVKIIVSGKNAEVYIIDMVEPVLFVNDLKRDFNSGKVGLSVSNFAPCHFANFSFTPLNNPPLKGEVKQPKNISENSVMSWWVSNTFEEKLLDNKFHLTNSDKENLTWNKLACEASGLANLARVHRIEEDKNCVITRITIVSEKEQVKKVGFGFSDRIKVYLNDQLIYGGNNLYQSRDYRFLGTIGYFDELYLPLKKGRNELWMAISESFGGWGVKARFDNMEDISIREE
jgi:hypothetical protein